MQLHQIFGTKVANEWNFILKESQLTIVNYNALNGFGHLEGKSGCARLGYNSCYMMNIIRRTYTVLVLGHKMVFTLLELNFP